MTRVGGAHRVITPFVGGGRFGLEGNSLLRALVAALHEAVLKREQRRPDAGRDPDLVVDVLDVVVDRLRRDEQGLRHLAVREAPNH